MKTSHIIFILVMAMLVIPAVSAGDNQYPDVVKYVTDNAEVLSPEEIETLNNHCYLIEQEHGVEIAIVTVPSTAGEDVIMFAAKTGDLNGVGNADRDDGITILLSLDDQPGYAIATGRGAEYTVTDAYASKFAHEAEPLLNDGKYFEGFENTLSKLETHYATTTPGSGVASSQKSGIEGIAISCISAVLIVLVIRRNHDQAKPD